MTNLGYLPGSIAAGAWSWPRIVEL
jgi:hypothetical protein